MATDAVTPAEALQLLGMLQRMAEETGDEVALVPPARGGWVVRVGARTSFRQKDLPTAIDVIANRLGLTDRIGRAAMPTIPEKP